MTATINLNSFKYTGIDRNEGPGWGRGDVLMDRFVPNANLSNIQYSLSNYDNFRIDGYGNLYLRGGDDFENRNDGFVIPNDYYYPGLNPNNGTMAFGVTVTVGGYVSGVWQTGDMHFSYFLNNTNDAGKNDMPTLFYSDVAATASFTENATGFVTSFRVYDADNSAFNYSLSGDDADYFSINNQGQLYVKQGLDYETKEAYHVNIHAVGVGNETVIGLGSRVATHAFTLSVGNVNDSPFAFYTRDGYAPSLVSINENNAVSDQVVASFRVMDADTASGGLVSYGLSGDDADYFSIGHDGVLRFASTLDYELMADHGENYVVEVTATAVDGTVISKILALQVNNINDEATSWTRNPQGFSINENNKLGLVVATFGAIDDDGQLVSYSLSGADADVFAIDARGRLSVRQRLDAESTIHPNDNYSIVVHAHAYGQGIANDAIDNISQLFVLSVNNINDNPVVWTGNVGRNLSLRENDTANLSLAVFSAFDLDGTPISYSLLGADANYFSITHDGVLQFKSLLDYDNGHAPHYSVVVLASSGGDNIGQGFALDISDRTTISYSPSGLFTNLKDSNGNHDLVNLKGLVYNNGAGDITINNLTDLQNSFGNGYTGGTGRNHWSFDYSGDEPSINGYMVFDKDGLARTRNDKIFLYGGDDAAPEQPQHFTWQNDGSLTYDKFLELLGGTNNIEFI